MGTVNILECVRLNPCVKSFLNVTTDKVYENREWEYGYREVDRLDGYDPYSNSKSCSELVTHSYKKSFFADGHLSLIHICSSGREQDRTQTPSGRTGDIHEDRDTQPAGERTYSS